MKKTSLLNRMFFAGLCAIVLQSPASAKSLNLVSTDPDHPIQTIDDKRYVFAKKDDQVTFKATTDSSVYSLTWTFENGTPGTGNADGPHSVTYGENAVGKVSVVKFTTKRYDEDDNHCVTENKRTCAVVVPVTEFKLSGGSEYRQVNALVPHKENAKIGVYAGDVLEFRDKPVGVSIPNGQYSWQGEASGNGATKLVTFADTGEKSVKLKIYGYETNEVKIAVRSAASGMNEDAAGAFVVAVYARVGGAELGTYAFNMLWAAKNKAIAWRGVTSSSGIDDIRDAERHCYWNALMTRDLGKWAAELVANGHEVTGGEQSTPDLHNSNVMDIDNNNVGQHLTTYLSSATDAQLQNATLAKSSSGDLVYMTAIRDPLALLIPSNQ